LTQIVVTEFRLCTNAKEPDALRKQVTWLKQAGVIKSKQERKASKINMRQLYYLQQMTTQLTTARRTNTLPAA